MRTWITKSTFLLVTIAIMAFALEAAEPDPVWQSWGYSSDESGGSSYLGVDTRNVTSDRLGALVLKEEKGVEVTMVDQDAPAGKAGLKEHDVILSLNGAEVESVEQLRRMIRETPPGRVVTLGISRNGQPMTIKAQLADRKKAFAYSAPEPQEFKFAMPAMPAMPDMDVPVSVVVLHSSTRSGLMIENLSPQLGDFFGAKNGQGVLVRSVEKGTPAEAAGFRAGDVIVKVNGESISDTGDFTHALHSRKDTSVSVGVIRDKKEQNLTLALPARKQSRLLDESVDVPELDAETQVEIKKAQNEVARMKPEMEKAMREVERARPEIERAAREAARAQEEVQREMRELQRQMQDQQQEFLQESPKFPHTRADI